MIALLGMACVAACCVVAAGLFAVIRFVADRLDLF